MSDSGDSTDFSQDEIDALMAGMGDESAGSPQPDASAEQPEPPPAESPEVPQGDLSQDDINALLGTTGPSGGSSSEVTQGDIDDIFASASAGGEAAPEADGEVSQADIDALMAGGGTPSGEVSQADIDALMAAAGAAQAGGSPPEADTRVDTLGRPFDEAAAAMQAAIEEEQQAAPAAPPVDVEAVHLPDLASDETGGGEAHRVSMLNDVNLNVRIELGRTRMLVEDVLRLGEGSVVELERLAGDPVDVFVNSRLIARGEVLVLNDNFCVRISEVLSHDPHRIAS